jgi:hypothetical protein
MLSALLDLNVAGGTQYEKEGLLPTEEILERAISEK